MKNSCIEETNLSLAWARAFLTTINAAGGEINPLIVKVTGFNEGCIVEDERIRRIINENNVLKQKFNMSNDYIETIASTIFPQSQWNKKKSRNVLFDRYNKTYPIMKKVKANNNGIYFHRLIAFDNGDDKPVNQLEHIIQAYVGDVGATSPCHRRSALQAAIFDPRKDHTKSKQRGFPCLQQIAFAPLGTNGKKGLRITGFYAKQLILEKAYGNYLGLCRLGYFMAKEMGLELKEMICFANVASYADPAKFSKTMLKPFRIALEKLI